MSEFDRINRMCSYLEDVDEIVPVHFHECRESVERRIGTRPMIIRTTEGIREKMRTLFKLRQLFDFRAKLAGKKRGEHDRDTHNDPQSHTSFTE